MCDFNLIPESMWLGGGNFGNSFNLLGPGLYLVGYEFFCESSRTNSCTKVSLPWPSALDIRTLVHSFWLHRQSVCV